MTVTTVTTAAERAEIRTMARELAQRELAPRAAALDAGSEDAMHECWRLLVELGLDRALLDEHHGGAGLGIPDLLVTIEELAVGDGGDRDVRAALQRRPGDAHRRAARRMSRRGHAGRSCRPRSEQR